MKSKMKSLLSLAPFLALEAYAHMMWLEPVEGGYKAYFGEPGEGLREKKEKLAGLGPIKAWDGAGKEIKTVLAEDHLFLAAGPGGATVAAVEGPLHGEGEKALRVEFHAQTAAPKQKPATPRSTLEIFPDGGDGTAFTLLKGGKPYVDGKLEMFAPGGWNRSYKADAQGKVKLETPWAGLYILEAAESDKVPGKAGEKPYKATYTAASYTFLKK